MPAQAQYPGGGVHGSYAWSDSTGQSPTYSGVQTVIDDGNGPGSPQPYGWRDPTHPVIWGGAGDIYPQYGKGVSLTCSGPITATFTWKPDARNPGEPPPGSVIVEQDSEVNTYVYDSIGTGSYATGLGKSGTGDGYAKDTAYTFKSDPGASFSISPYSPYVATTSPATSYGCGGYVNYSATAISP